MMELYILDDQLRKVEVIDVFESLIWTERFAAWGDFELSIFSTPRSRTLLTNGTRLALNRSYRVMEIESAENKVGSDGQRMLKVKGRSLEYILDNRISRNSVSGLEEVPTWNITNKPATVARTVFNAICRNNVKIVSDNIPFLKSGNILPPSTIAEPDTSVTMEIKPETVYTTLQDICQAYDLGFRLIRNFEASELYFDVFAGSDRTTTQTVLPPVVFSPTLDNLTDVTELETTDDYKNVAYVYHNQGFAMVTADSSGVLNPQGLDRRVMHVDASSIQLPERTYVLTQAQLDAIQATLNIASLSEPQKTALGKLRDKKRLLAAESIMMDTVGGSKVTTAQRSALKAARDVSVSYNDTETAFLQPLLIQKGKEELAKARSLSALDGEIPQNSPYRYGTAYQLGDVVEMHNTDGVANRMRVSEQIFVSNAEGEREYPTLTVDKYLMPGTWASWDTNYDWLNGAGSWVDK